MTNNHVTLLFGLSSMNEIIAAAKKHPKAYSRMKKAHTEAVAQSLIEQGCVPPTPYETISLSIVWVEKDRRRDPDNIRAGAKPLLDGMVKAGVIMDDRYKNIMALSDTFEISEYKNRMVKASWSVC